MFSKDDFEELISARTGVARAEVGAHSRLGADLGLDSYSLLELAAALAESGADLGEREWLTASTVGELYDHYRAGLDRRAAGSSGSPVPGLPAGAVGQAGQVRPVGAVSPSGEVVEPPRMAGQYFRLAPVMPQTVPFLYDLAVRPDVGFRWRYRGSVPPYQQFEQELWQGMLVQFVVESVETGQPAGHVLCYNPDFALGHAYVGAAMTSHYLGSGIGAEPVQLFIHYLFDVWPFEKLYLEMPEFNYWQFASVAGKVMHVEARLRGHDYYKGRRFDRLVLAVYRDGAGPEDVAAPATRVSP